MTTINPYLTFDGNCEEAFNFYRSVFGGDFEYLGRFEEMTQYPIPESEQHKIMHVTLPITKETVLMGSDTSQAFGQSNVAGNNFSLSINAESETEANSICESLSEGGKITKPMRKTFWGAYNGKVRDKYGVQWMINYDYNKN